MKETVTEIKCATGGNFTVQEVERDVEPVEEQAPQPTVQEDMAAMLVDLAYRVALLEKEGKE